jgi:hypothetical protein
MGTLTGDVTTLAVPLWIMAAISIVEALVLLAIGIGGWLAYSRVMTLVAELEARQIAPLREKVDAILVDVKTVTARVAHQTERVDEAVIGTIQRVDETAARLRAGVYDTVTQTVGVIRGIRAVIMSLFHTASHA